MAHHNPPSSYQDNPRALTHVASLGRHEITNEFGEQYYPNLSWKRDSTDTAGLGGSLLSRMQPSQDSLINRITPASHKDPSPSLLVETVSDQGPAPENEGNSTVNTSMADSAMAELIIASALAEHQKASTDEGPPTSHEHGLPTQEILAATSLEGANGAKGADGVTTSDAAAESESPVSAGEPTQVELVEQAKRLLVPIITQNARLRDPGADAEVIKARVMSLITDEQCLEFLKLAKDIRVEMHERAISPSVLVANPAGTSALPRPSNTSVQGITAGDSTQSSAGPSQSSPGVVQSSVGYGNVPKAGTPTRHSYERSPSGGKTPPSAPRVMREGLTRSQLSPGRQSPRTPAIHANESLSGSVTELEGGQTVNNSDVVKVPAEANTLPDRVPESSSNEERIISKPLPRGTATIGVVDIVPLSVDEDDQTSREPASTTIDLTQAAPSVPGETSEIHVDCGEQLPQPTESVTSEETSQAQSTKLSPPATSEPRHDTASPHEAESSNAKDTVETKTLMTQDEIAQSVMEVDHPTVDGQPDSCTREFLPSAAVQKMSPPVINVAPARTQENPSGPTTAVGTVTEEAPVKPSSAVPPMTEINGLALPRLLFVVPGRVSPDVSEIVFEVDDVLASATHRWTARQTVHDQLDRYASVFLLCLPVAQVRTAYEQLGAEASPENIANTLWDIPTKWPQRGKLIVEMNSGTATEQTWLPRQMGPNDGPLEVTAYVQPGENTARFIQLADSSQYLFVFFARQPLERERKWVSLVRSRGSASQGALIPPGPASSAKQVQVF